MLKLTHASEMILPSAFSCAVSAPPVANRHKNNFRNVFEEGA